MILSIVYFVTIFKYRTDQMNNIDYKKKKVREKRESMRYLQSAQMNHINTNQQCYIDFFFLSVTTN
jgi:hypothetical protein